MPRTPSTFVPSYRLHKQSGQAVVTLCGRDFLLGKHSSKESLARYDQLIARYIAAGRQLPPDMAPTLVRAGGSGVWTVRRLCDDYLQHAHAYYRKPDGRPTGEADNIELSVEPLRRRFGGLPVTEFGPRCFQLLRDELVTSNRLVRTQINDRMRRIQNMFRWGVSQETVPPAVHQALKAVAPLKAGRSAAKDLPPSPRRSLRQFLVISRQLSPVLRGMVLVELLTAMRPGEIEVMRPCDIDRGSSPWIYRPRTHKTEHIAADRQIPLGPRAQRVIGQFVTDWASQKEIFSPRAAMAWHRKQREAARVTPLSCGNRAGTNRKTAPRWSPRSRYDRKTFALAVKRVCHRQWPVPPELEGFARKSWMRVHHWTPYDLRRFAAQFYERQFGPETARLLLGHRSLKATHIYVRDDARRLAQAVRLAG